MKKVIRICDGCFIDNTVTQVSSYRVNSTCKGLVHDPDKYLEDDHWVYFEYCDKCAAPKLSLFGPEMQRA